MLGSRIVVRLLLLFALNFIVLFAIPRGATAGDVSGHALRRTLTAPSAPRAAAACDAPDDSYWWDGFALPIQNGFQLQAAVVDGDDLIVGGYFTQAGHARAVYVAKWNGTAWSALGGADPPFGITALALWNGHLVAGGQPYEGPSSRPAVYEFDGASWSPLGTMANVPSNDIIIYSLASFGGDLYAGGSFTHADGESTGCVARWDGSAWHAVGSGFPAGGVLALTVHGTKLVAGGFFQPNDNIAQWDGSSWSPIGTGSPGDIVQALASDGVNLYAGSSIARRWNGTSWTTLTGLGSGVFGLAIFNGEVVASGGAVSGNPYDHVARRSGNMWVAMGDQTERPAHFIVPWGSRLVVGGDIASVGHQLANDLSVYDGSTWTPVFEPWGPEMSGLWSGANAGLIWGGRLVVGQSPAQCGGLSWPRAGDQTQWISSSGVTAWDGAHWSSIGDISNSNVFALADWQGALVAGGQFSRLGAPNLGPGRGSFVRNVARWNGSSWDSLAGGLTGANGWVYGLATHGSDLVAIGQFASSFSGVVLNGAGRWDGTAWHPLGSGFNVGGFVDFPAAALPYGSDLIVTGRFPAAGGVAASNIARWDGASWNALGDGLDGEGYALTTFEGDLVVGGEFTHAGGAPAAAVARWNGSTWSPIGDNAIEVQALRVVEGRLFAAGEFRCADQSEAVGLAMWTGSVWQMLGSGFDPGSFTFIQGYGGDVYVGGGIGHGAGKASFGIARWMGLSRLAVPKATSFPVRLEAPRPNPSSATVELAYELPAAGHVRLTVFDPAGRRVTSLVDGDRVAGRQVVRWDGTDARGRATRAGLYFARLETPFGGRTARFLRLP